MKKLFIFLVTISIFSFSACSKDDKADTPTKTLKATINGVEVIFDTFKVDKIDYAGYSDLEVTATKSNDVTKKIIFKFEYLVKGKETCYYFVYTDGDADYVHNAENKTFEVNVTENTESRHIKGTFMGTIPRLENPNPITIPNGNFDINY